MLKTQLECTLGFDGGHKSMVVKCNVRFSVQFIGEIVEDIDRNLVEDYDEDVPARLLIRLTRLVLSLPEAMWLAKFLISPSKTITVDGRKFEIVNQQDVVDFELWQDWDIATELELNFAAKYPGLTPEISGGIGGAYVSKHGVTP